MRKDLILVNDSFFVKNKAARITVCLALCIPILLAFIASKNIDPNSVNALYVTQVSVEHGENTSTFTDKESIDIYSSISQNVSSADENFRDFSAETPYTVKFTQSDNSVLTYKLYLVEDTNDCIFSNENNEYFIINPEVAKALIVRDEFVSVNADSFLPVATITRSGKTITLSPSVYTWNYTSIDGQLKQSGGERTVDNPTVKFNKDNIGTLSFDREPDKVTVSINSENYSDSFENLSALSYDSDYKLDMQIVAEWYQLEGSQFYGKLIYNLDALYDVKPTFRQVDSSIRRGDFTIIRASDFNDDEKLTIINSLGIPEEVPMYDIPGKRVKFAFVPLSYSSSLGNSSITYKSQDGDEYTANLTVRDFVNSPGSKTVVVGDTSLHESFSSQALEEWNSVVSKYTLESEPSVLWDGKFSYPTGSKQIVSGGASYGTKLNVISPYYSGEYVSNGMDLAPSSDKAVCAANNGNVVFAGELAFMGKTVIIDHGCGLLSYYGHLDTLDVKEGDAVTKTTVLGTSGSTGFACNASGNRVTMLHFAVSMNGVFIDPVSPCSAINLGN